MAGNIKGITIEIGGNTQPLNNALKNVNDTIYNTQKELTNVNKLLKFDPKNVTLLTQKQQLLEKQLGATRDKLEKLKLAQEQAKDALAKGEIGEEQYRELERQVIQTEQHLGRLEKQSDETKAALDEAGKEAEGAGGEFKNAGNESKSFGEKMKTLAAVTIVVKNVAQAVGDVANKIMELGKAGAQYADDINTMAAKFGTSAEDLQKFQYASDLVDVSVETFGGSLQKLTRNIGQAQAGSKKQVETFDKLGVSITDANGNLRDSEDIFYDVIDALGNISNETEADIAANNILGKSYAELKPLIKTGTDTLRDLGEEAQDVGYVLGDDMLSSLNSMQDAMDRNKRITEGLGNQFSGGFAKSMTDAQNKINETLANPKTRESIAKVGEAVGAVVSALTDVANFVLKNADAILLFLGGIAAALVAMNFSSIAGKIGEIGLKIADLVKGIGAAIAANPVGLILSAVAALGALSIALGKPSEEIQALKDKSDELKKSTDDLFTSFENQQTTLAGTADEASKMTDEANKLNESIIQMRKEGKDTTAQEQALAKQVRNINGVMGERVATIDAETGLLRESTAEIKKNIEQIKAQAEAQALQEYYIDLKKQQIELEGQSQKALEEVAKAQQAYDNAGVDFANKRLNEFKATVEAYDTASGSLDGLNEELEKIEARMANQPKVNQEAAESITIISDAEANRLLFMQANDQALTEEQEALLATYKENNEEQYNSLSELAKKEAELQKQRLGLMQQSDKQINDQSDISLKQRAENIRKNTQKILDYERNLNYLRVIATQTANKQQRDAFLQMINNFSDYSEDSIAQVNALSNDFKKAGGQQARDYINAYAETYTAGGTQKLASATANATGTAINAGASEFKTNKSLTSEATGAIVRTKTALTSQVGQSDFSTVGAKILNDMARGFKTSERYLLDTLDSVLKKIRNKLTFNVSVGNRSISTNIPHYATGGIAWTPQVASLAEREPEAIIPLSKLGAMVNSSRSYGTPAVNVTMNVQRVTDAEAYRLVDIVGREFARRTGGRV